MSINERLKFLIKELGISARAFSKKLEVPDTTTRNYLDKDTKLNSEYLERIVHHFKEVNLNWLVTGEGSHFLFQPIENTLPTTNAKKISRSQIVGTNHGVAYQEQNSSSLPDEKYLTALATAHKEIALLTSQLADKERTIQILLKQTS